MLYTMWLMAVLAFGGLGARSTQASETSISVWAVGFGKPGISTELSLFNAGPGSVGIGITFMDDKEQRVIEVNTGLTPFERKDFDLEALLAGTTAPVSLFLVTGSSATPGALSGSVITGLDPGGSVDGKARLLLDPDGNVIASARGLTSHELLRLERAAEKLTAPLGLTTLSPAPGDGIQTFLVFANVGSEPMQSVQIEFFGDNELFLGDCSFVLTPFDLVITRPGLPELGDPCPVDLTPTIVTPDSTTARWAASLRTVPSDKVLIGQVVVVNTRSREAFAYPMQ